MWKTIYFTRLSVISTIERRVAGRMMELEGIWKEAVMV
jgi:hypothetical protein